MLIAQPGILHTTPFGANLVAISLGFTDGLPKFFNSFFEGQPLINLPTAVSKRQTTGGTFARDR